MKIRLLYEMSDSKVDAMNAYFYNRRPVGEHTIKLILYKDILGESNWLTTLSNIFYSLDGIKIKPNNKKLTTEKIDMLLFTPYIDGEEKDKIEYVYSKCISSNYPKIDNFDRDLNQYIFMLDKVYIEYKNKIIPMLASKTSYSQVDYLSEVKNIFSSIQ